MRRSKRPNELRWSMASVAAIVGLVIVASDTVPAQQVVPGTNVNMVSGTTFPEGDPYLQRQNEPSSAVSTRNPLHILGGANDYRTVDIPHPFDVLRPQRMSADAWVGLFKSLDGGQNWKSTLLPGYPQDPTQAAPLWGYDAATDAFVRAGTNGMLYFSGLVFDRGENTPSAIFVARFMDMNNLEAGDPIIHLNTRIVDSDGGARFLDKNALATDIARTAATCSFSVPFPEAPGGQISQTIPAGNVYVAYTAFTGSGATAQSVILFSRSTDCGQTWSAPKALSTGSRLVQNAQIAVNPVNGDVYVSWRRFRYLSQDDAVMVTRSTDGGATFSRPVRVAGVRAFDQGSTLTSFRTNGFQTMAIDGSGRVYLAWTERGHASLRPDPVDGDARIVISTSTNGSIWTVPRPVQTAGLGHQVMPALTFHGGRLRLLYYDLREDASQLFGPFVDEGPILNGPTPRIRHTLDVFVAQALPSAAPVFTTARLSDYAYGFVPGVELEQRLQYNPPNLPLFRQGTTPFMGDYIDLAPAPAYVQNADGSWAHNIAATGNAISHAFWTDNRDVRPPPDGVWTHYTPVTSPALRATNGLSRFDPTLPVPACDPDRVGMRNQNIYTARVSEGLFVSAPGNQKPLSGSLERAFVVVAENNTSLIRSFRLTIDNQPIGGAASFLQFDPVTTLDVTVPPASSMARSVFVTSSQENARVTVSVAEIAAPGAPAPIPGGLTGIAVLNPDPQGPRLQSPRLQSPGLNPEFTEAYNAAITNAVFAAPRLQSPRLQSPTIVNPRLQSDSLGNPRLQSDSVANPGVLVAGLTNTSTENAALSNPRLQSPRLQSADLTNAGFSDTSWEIKNNGNTTAAYTINLVLTEPIPSTFVSQLLVHKTFTTPAADGCRLAEQPHTVLVTNIPDPDFVDPSNPAEIGNPRLQSPRLQSPTLALGPGESATVTLRVVDTNRYDGVMFDPAAAVVPAAVSQSVNTVDAATTEQPPVALPLTITTASVPMAEPGQPYVANLGSFAASGALTCVVASGQFPPGLTLSTTGSITGTPTTPGNYRFTVRCTDASGNVDDQTLSLQVDPPVPTGFDATWNGATTDWADPMNWSPRGVPGPTARVYISASIPLVAMLTRNETIRDLFVEPGATVNTNGFTLTVTGNVDAGRTIVGSGTTILTGDGGTATGVFSNLEIRGRTILNGSVTTTGGLTLGAGARLDLNGQSLIVGGPLTSNVTEGSVPFVSGPASAFTVTGVDVNGLLLSHAPLTINGGNLLRFDNVSLGPFAPEATQLTVNHPGLVANFAMTGLAFSTAPTTGQYVRATDTLADGSILTLDIMGAAPADGAAATGTAGGAIVNWLSNPGANLAVTQTVSPVPAAAGTPLMYSITVFNGGPATATGVTLNPGIPEGAAGVTTTTTQGSCEVGSGGWSCDLGTIPSGGSVLVTATYVPSGTGSIDTTASVTGNESDSAPGNNSHTIRATVAPADSSVSLSIEKTDSVDPVAPGTPFTYALSVTNAGTTVATDVLVTDPIPTGLEISGVAATQGSCTIAAGQVVCAVGTLAPAQVVTITLSATASAPRLITNVAVVTSAGIELTPADNVAYQPTTVQAASENAAPMVNAGGDQSISLPAGASLDGTVTDDGLPAGSELSTTWSQVSGPGMTTFADPSAVDTTATFSGPGTYVLRLSASDDDLSAFDEVTITVSPANQAPVVNAGDDQSITLPAHAALNGSVTDDGLPAGGTLTAIWAQQSGPGTATFADPNDPTTTASFSQAGTYVLRLTGSDGAVSAFDEVSVTVLGAPALSNVSPNSGQQGQLNLLIALTGQNTHWVDGTTAATFGTGVTVNGVSVSDATHATANISISIEAPVGLRTVTVTTGSEVVALVDSFVVNGMARLLSINPASGQQGQINLLVTLTGENTAWVDGVTTASFGADITVNAVTVSGPAAAVANISIDPTAVTGSRAVSVATGSEVVLLSAAFLVTAGPATIANVNPNTGTQGQALTVLVTGSNTHFSDGNTTASFGIGISVGTITVTSPTSASVEIAIGPSAAPGARTVTLSTGGESASAIDAFTVIAGTAVISQVNPSSGVQGQQSLAITITGQFTHFVQGTTTVSLGTGISVGAITVNSATELVATINIDPITTIGSRSVSVTTGGETATGGVFTVNAGPAALTTVSPNSAQQGQLLEVTITGSATHFQQDVSTASFGSLVNVVVLTVDSPTQVRAQLSINPGAALGARTVTVTTAGESASLADGFTVTAGTTAISLIDPNSAQQGQSLDVAITGQFTHFAQGTTDVVFGAGITVNRIAVADATHLTASVTIGPTAAVGARTVTVTSGTEVVTAGFSVAAGPAALSALSPNFGQQGQTGLSVAITGIATHFLSDTTAASFGPGINVTSFTVTSPTSATAVLSVASDASVGPRTVTLRTDGENASNVNGFSVTPGSAAVTNINPSSAAQGQILDVAIASVFTHFDQATTEVDFGTGITINSVAVADATHLTANVTVSPTTDTGGRTVTVRTGTEVVTTGFFVSAGAAALTLFTPSSGQQGQAGLDVAITGSQTHFASLTTVANFGPGITVNSLTISSPTSASVNITIVHGTGTGPRDVTLTTGGEIASGSFTVTPGTPAITSLTPNSGVQGQMLDVSVLAQFTNFVNGTTTAAFGAGITVNTVTVTSPTSATVNITISPTAFTGLRTIALSTGTESVSSSFLVNQGPALLSALNPISGGQGQANLNVAVTGQNTHFVQDVTAASFGSGVTVNGVTVTSATSATVNITIQEFAAPGLRTVTLSTDGQVASIENGFNVVAATPRLTFVNPASGQQGQTLDVAVTGQFTHFAAGTTANFGAGVTVNSVMVTSATSATVNISISPLASVDVRTVTLTTDTETASSLASGSFFSVTASSAVIAAVNPNNGRRGESLTGVVLTGANTHFASGSTNISFGSGIMVTSLAINGPTSATVNITIDQSAPLGLRPVTATTLGEFAQIADGFTVNPGLAAISTVTPATGRQAQTLDVNVVGQFTNFVDGTTTANFGAGITVNAVAVSTATTATVNITIGPNATPGSRIVTMTTGMETAQQVGGFTVTPGQPTFLSMSPTSGMQGTNTTVILNGGFTNFTAGLTTVFFGSDISVGTVTVNGPELASVPITIGAGASIGPRSVTITTGSEVVTLINGFTVLQGVPTVTAINPNAAQRGLTLNVDITGVFTNWQSGVTTVSYGAGVTVNSNVIHSATQLTNNITIDAGATLAPRDVVVTTGPEVLTVAGGFVVNDVDVTAPSILTISPAYTATGVPLNANVTVEFSEPLRRGSIADASIQLYDTFTGIYVGGTTALDMTGRILTFVPSQLLAVNRGYYIFFSSDIEDVAGNNFFSGLYYFTTGFSTDTTGPTLTLANPQNGDADIGRNVTILLQFDRPLNLATRSVGLLIRTGGVTVPGTYAFEDGLRRIRFTPATALAASTEYTVTLTSQLRDVAGNSLTNPGTVSFTTGAASDTTAPTVTSYSPAYGDTGVGRLPIIRITFSERMNPITFSSSSFYLYNAGIGAYIRTTMTVAENRMSVTLAPDAPLEPYSQYFYFLSATDLAGNGVGLGVIYFLTGADSDATVPTVVTVDPPDGTPGLPVNTRVRVVMSEAIDPTSISNASIQLTPTVAGAVAAVTDRRTLTFTPGTNLATSTTYTVQVNGLRDLAGNTMSPFNSTFTTGVSATPDNTAPTVVSISPANAATNVAVNSAIVMTVSERIRAGTVGLTSMPVFASAPGVGFTQLAGTYDIDPTGRVVTFTPSAPYPGGSQITVYLNYDSSITDLAGNVLQFVISGFTTEAVADTTPPTVVMVTPPNGATGIGPYAVITLTFSEPLLPTTVTNDTFTLFNGGTELGPSITRSADNTMVFLSTLLPFNRPITVFVTNGVTDVSGNPLADFSTTFETGSTIETNQPQILTQRPTGPGIAAGTNITLFASKPLNPSTVPGAVFVSQNGVLVDGDVTVTSGGTAIHFDPAADFAPGSAVQVFMTGAAQDTFGNALYDHSGSFTVAADTVTQAPFIVRTSPAFAASGLPTNAIIEIQFSEPLNPATVTSANVFVHNALSQPLAGTLTLHDEDRVVRFTPTDLFALNNYNYVYLMSGLRDLQNVQFGAASFYFYTGAGSDPVAPAVTSLAPPDGARVIGTNASVRIRFSEAINPISVSAESISLASAAGQVPVAFTFDTVNTVVTVVPQAPLPAGTLLTLSLNEGVEDTAGNAIVPQTSQFTTGAGADTRQPSVVMTNVTAYGANNVPTNTVFQVTFDEPMEAATVLGAMNTFLYDYSVGYLPGVASMSGDGRTLTFVPDSVLAVNRTHSLNLYSGIDLTGNPMIGFSILFSTTFASDTSPPVVSGVNPVAGSVGQPRNVTVQLLFNEPVMQGSVNDLILLNGSTPVPVTRTLSDGNRTVTLRPDGVLAAGVTYTVSASGVRDIGNNVMASTFTSTFTTGSSADLIPPTVLGTSPQYADRGVGLNVVVRLVFSEPVHPLSVNNETLRIGNGAGGPFLDATVSLASDRLSATLTPDAPLLPSTQYFFQLINLLDGAGNSGGGPFYYFFTGDAIDATPPSVVALTPPDGTLGVPVNARVVAVMSEAIDGTSISNASIQLTPAAAGAVTLAVDRVTLMFVPSANLAPSTNYSVHISGLRDAAANVMAPATFAFTTGASATPDATAPTIVARSPVNGASGIGVTSSLTFTTSERITASAVGPVSAPVFAVLSGVGTFQIAGVYTVDPTGTIVTFAVTGAFPANATIYWYSNNNGAIRDMAGLVLPNEFSTFTTANTPDVTGPTVQTVTPPDGATGIGPYAVIALTFSESVNPNTVNNTTLTLFVGGTILVPGISLSADNRMVFLGAVLPMNSTITIVSSGIRDLSGNDLPDFSSSFETAPQFDFDRPQVVTQRPTGSGVSRNSPITLFLNQEVNPATVPSALFVSVNGVLVSGAVSVAASNQAITFTPDALYASGTSVEVVLTQAAEDFGGNPVYPHYGIFTTENDPAASSPTLTRTNPVQYSFGNPINTLVELEFSEPLDPATVTPANVYVTNAAGLLVSGTLSLRNGNRVVRFESDADFAPDNYNYVTYTNGLRDLQGTAATTSSFYFYTGAASDSTNPSVSSIAPPAGAIGVGVNASIRITFNEAINPLSISSSTVQVSAGVALGTTFVLAGNTLLTVTPQRPLPPGTVITITIDGVEDVSGNAVPLTTSSFTTGAAPDTVAPVATAFNIAYGDTSVPVNTVFEWTYSEPIDAATVIGQANVLYDYAVGYVPGGTLSVSPDSRTVTFVPPANLTAGHQYSLSFGGVSDLSGNSSGGFSLFFTAAAASDGTAPQVLGVTPGDGLTGVPRNARVRVAFDEAVSWTSVENVNVLLEGSPLDVASRTLSNGNRLLTLTLSELMAPNTIHRISIDGVEDRAGNALPDTMTTSFTTGTAVDLVYSTSTVTASPAQGASGVPVDTAPTVTFNEAIDATSVILGGTGGVVLQVAATGEVVPVTYSFSADFRTVTLTPVAPLAAGTQYRTQVSTGVLDLAGNYFPAFLQFLFTTQP